MFKKTVLISSMSLILMACSDNPSDKELSTAIENRFNTSPHNAICAVFDPKVNSFPVEVDKNNQTLVQQLDLFVDLGFLTKEEKEIDYPISSFDFMPSDLDRKIPGYSYQLNPTNSKSQKYLHNVGNSFSGGKSAFCYGEISVTKINQFTPPVTPPYYDDSLVVTEVNYDFEVINIPEWADNDKLNRLFPNLQRQHKGAGRTIELINRGNGWIYENPLGM